MFERNSSAFCEGVERQRNVKFQQPWRGVFVQSFSWRGLNCLHDVLFGSLVLLTCFLVRWCSDG